MVVDAGHGGTNLGAPSVQPDVYEKHFTLALAKDVAKELSARGIVVHLTRTTDRYLTLRQRSSMANKMGADLFISLHGNATEEHAQAGFETYILTPRAVDIDSRALRRGSGRPRPGVARSTALLLDDIERATSQFPAAKLARAVQNELGALRGKNKDRGVRQDAMHVLLGATMPAVLVEVGFIDHPVEGKELLDPKVRGAIAKHLAKAVAENKLLLRAHRP